jgi:hypothetical protein
VTLDGINVVAVWGPGAGQSWDRSHSQAFVSCVRLALHRDELERTLVNAGSVSATDTDGRRRLFRRMLTAAPTQPSAGPDRAKGLTTCA